MSLSVRGRRVIACACIAGALACLILAAPSAAVTVPAVLSIAGALLYLHSSTGAVAHMSNADRQAWQSARTLGDLGELTARWLEGSVASVPGYCCRPAEETEHLVPVLAKLNRTGFVTTGSQPGEVFGVDDLGRHRAAVEGFASWAVAEAIETAAVHADLIAVVHDPVTLPRWRYYRGEAVIVTKIGDRDFTGFGVQLPRRHIRDAHLGYGICHPDAVDALCEAWQVTVIDPQWGRPDVLWQVLAEAVSPAGGTR